MLTVKGYFLFVYGFSKSGRKNPSAFVKLMTNLVISLAEC